MQLFIADLAVVGTVAFYTVREIGVAGRTLLRVVLLGVRGTIELSARLALLIVCAGGAVCAIIA